MSKDNRALNFEEIKQLLKKVGVDTLVVGPEKISFSANSPGSRLDPARAISLIASAPKKYQLTPDSKFVAKIASKSLHELTLELEKLLQILAPNLIDKKTSPQK